MERRRVMQLHDESRGGHKATITSGRRHGCSRSRTVTAVNDQFADRGRTLAPEFEAGCPIRRYV
jgi:hypothetical protein